MICVKPLSFAILWTFACNPGTPAARCQSLPVSISNVEDDGLNGLPRDLRQPSEKESLSSQKSDRDASLVSQINFLNQEVLHASLTSAELGALLTNRTRLMVQLMEDDPGQTATLSLSPEVLSRISSGRANTELTGKWTGTLEATIQDDFKEGRSRERWYLHTGGSRVELHFDSTPTQHSGAKVAVSGLAIAGHLAVSRIASTVVEHDSTGLQRCTTTGPQNTAVLVLTTPSFPSVPPGFSAVNLQQAFFSGSSSLKAYLEEMSYGKTSATGQVFGPFALDRDYMCDETAAIEKAAIDAADSSVDFTQFTHIALFFPVSSCPSYSGQDTVGCSVVQSASKGTVSSSIGWFPAVAGTSPDPRVVAHEMGHALGLGHSGSDSYGTEPLGPVDLAGNLSEYGDPNSMMGIGNSDARAGQYTSEQKSLALNWLAPGDYQEVLAGGNFNLRPFESATGLRALRILRDPASSAWLWIEYRQPIGDIDDQLGWFGGNVFSGALIHYEDPALDPTKTYMLNFGPQTGNFQDAVLTPGSSWSDPYSPLTLSVTGATSEGLLVSVAYDSLCASPSPSAADLGPTGGTGSISVSAPPSCGWTASTVNDWIHLAGGTSGQGNGVLTFMFDANPGTSQREGRITLQRHSVRIVQRGTAVSILSVSPDFGSGANKRFTFQVTEESGYGNILGILVHFTGSPDCVVQMTVDGGILLADDDGSWLGPIPLGSPGQALSNTVCSIYSAGSVFTGSLNQMQASLQMDFSSAFAGAHRITGATWNRMGTTTSTIPLGTWLVPARSSGLDECDSSRADASKAPSATSTSGSKPFGTRCVMRMNR